VALLTVSAQAQTSAVHPMTPGTAPATRPAEPVKPKPDPLAQSDVSKVIGASVYGSDGKEVGDVSTALMQPKTKKIDRLVVRSGGVLGIGGHYVALPVSDFSWDAHKEAFRIGKTAKELGTMAEWKAPQTGSASSSAAASTPAPADNAVGAGSSQPPNDQTPPASNQGH
jgi:sporulation protein YlmC with PRC-barrel domain